MIVDTSAIVAILRDEAGAAMFSRIMATSPTLRISAGTYVELGVVIEGMRDPVLSGAMDRLLEESRIRIEPVTESQARIARTAYQRFGRGSGHAARLNFGDCFAYALARELGEPLLFKGDDFRLTDIEIVTEPTRSKRLSEVVAAYGAGAP
jgi:ribonuclease VapC